MLEPAPGRIIRQQRRYLCEPEDEDEVEEQLEWRDPLLVLSEVLAHGWTLARRRSQWIRSSDARDKNRTCVRGFGTFFTSRETRLSNSLCSAPRIGARQ